MNETLPQAMQANLELVRNVEVFKSTENISFIEKAAKKRAPKPKEVVDVEELSGKDRHRYKEADRRVKEKSDFQSLLYVLQLDEKPTNKVCKNDLVV